MEVRSIVKPLMETNEEAEGRRSSSLWGETRHSPDCGGAAVAPRQIFRVWFPGPTLMASENRGIINNSNMVASPGSVKRS